MRVLRANRKTDAVKTPILDHCDRGGNIRCWFGKLRSILFNLDPHTAIVGSLCLLFGLGYLMLLGTHA